MVQQAEIQRILGADYRLQWVIGNGGMSTVWLADDTRHDREVAVKVLRPEFSDNEEFLSRFRNEALASENIHSDNVVSTYDYREGTDASGRTMCFIIMEYVRGESLADMLARRGRLEESLALDVLEQAAHGLSIIHRMGLVHRDIKPGNLLITQNGEVKITDFGIAKAAAAVPLTRTGMVVGTAQYVSPEQAQGRDVTAASDVYSLGVVGYEMLAGRRPFVGDSSVSVAIAHINQAPPALPTFVSAQARELVGIALRKDPGHRYADGNELALAVSTVRDGLRPPQPQSVMLQRIAPEPTPTASTHALGQVAQPTTIAPTTIAPTGMHTQMAPVPMQQHPQKVPAQQPRRAAQRPPARRQGSAAGIIMVFLLLAAVIAGLVWAGTQGLFDDLLGGSSEQSSQSPVTVTVSDTPQETTVEQQEPTTVQAPELEPTTVQPEPTTVVETPEATVPEAPRRQPTAEVNPAPTGDVVESLVNSLIQESDA